MALMCLAIASIELARRLEMAKYRPTLYQGREVRHRFRAVANTLGQGRGQTTVESTKLVSDENRLSIIDYDIRHESSRNKFRIHGLISFHWGRPTGLNSRSIHQRGAVSRSL